MAFLDLKTKKYQKALNDCEACLKMEPENVKALFRKGQALSEMRNHREACDTFEQVLAIDPSNSTASQEIIRLEQILPPKDTFRMKIEEIGEPILNEPTWKRAQKKTEKLELDENKKIPSMFQNIVPEEKSPFDGFNKKQPPKEKLVMPGNEKIGKKKGILIQEIN
jgi:tetratricopeptide (TPR) repeat protein